MADLEGRERNRGREPLSFRAEAKLQRRIFCIGSWTGLAQIAFAARGGLCVLHGDGKSRQLSLRRPQGTPPPSAEGGEKAGGIAKAGKYGALDRAREQGRDKRL